MARKIEGYKLNGYDATYDKALYNIHKRYEDADVCILEIMEIHSGITFIIELEKENKEHEQYAKIIKEKCREKRTQNTYWRTREQGPPERNGGVFIAVSDASRNRKRAVYAKRHDQSMPGRDSD